MLIKIVEYFCDHTPNMDDIKEAIDLASSNGEFKMVKLSWYVSYNGWHSTYLTSDGNAEEIYNKIPRRYGV